jgi:hypothetical protein
LKSRSNDKQRNWLDVLDDELVRGFAYKLHRMLCGASKILGLYVIAPNDTLIKHSASFETILKSLLLDRTTTATSTSDFYLITISLPTGHLSTSRSSFSEKNTSPTPEPISFRVLSSRASDLVRVETKWRLDLVVPVKRAISGEHEQRFQKTLVKSLTDEIAKIESSMVVDVQSGSIVNETESDDKINLNTICVKLGSTTTKLPDILAELEAPVSASSSSRSKRSKSSQSKAEEATNGAASPPTRNFIFLSLHPQPHDSQLTAHQVASGALRLRGVVVGSALVSRTALNFESQAYRALRIDLIRSLQSRAGLLFDDIARRSSINSITEEEADTTSFGRAKTISLSLPRRVLVKNPLQQASFCDYLLDTDTIEDSMDRIKMWLDLESDVELEELEMKAKDEAWSTKENQEMPSDSMSSPTPTPQLDQKITHKNEPLIRYPLILLIAFGLLALLALPIVLRATRLEKSLWKA